ncbi:MAG: selenide, water dikinase SelD [Proteobacteria bacterium]|nr:MAG: selenide, water dikinase SelD [Pseudomonadota bacterium]
MAPEALAQVLRPLKTLFDADAHPDLLIGLGRADDAAVYRLDDDRALVATTDFFTPIVDDPWAYGAIAAANSLSDVYAMGGRPIVALNIAALPPQLPTEVVAEIMRGGAEKVKEAGAVIAGGHTVQDKEPKYGLVALGLVDPRRMLTKGGAQRGDKLVLSKALGAGVITTALMRDRASEAQVAAATESMLKLNREASEVALACGVCAATDVTGFGLLGHASEMLRDVSSEIGFCFELEALPLLPGARDFAADYVYPGGAHNNRAFFGEGVRFADGLDEWQRLLCFSPETSGGLLMVVPAAQESELVARVAGAVTIGEVVDEPGLRVR